jgi:membrane protein DedA with SNARE-associated domain
VEMIAQWLVEFVERFGYLGIFIMTFLESTFVPIPSEVTMVPAGYLVHQGGMNFMLVLLVSTTGAVAGSLANYWIAHRYGRRFLYAYGHYMLFSHEKMAALDIFFAKHGEISTFTGRLVPGLRHFIAFPAGLAHMHLKKFCIYTGLGSALWMTTLLLVGYFIGGNKELVRDYMPVITTVVIGVVALLLAGYVLRHRLRNNKE